MDGEAPLPYDPRHWHNVQPPKAMDVSRRFEYDEDQLSLLRKWLRLANGPRTIVEVGCGSGFFTEKLSEMAPGSEIIGVEPDDVLREYVEGKGIQRARFLNGTAEEIPLPSDYSDLTVCHIVLNNLPDIPRAVREMARVTNSGGVVAAIEPIGGSVSYQPDRRLGELNEEARRAIGRGIWELRSKEIYDRELPESWRARYSEVFHSCGLERVEAHGLLSVFLLSDARRDREEIIAWLEERLEFDERDEERKRVVLRRGGMDEGTIDEVIGANREHIKGLLENPDTISETHQLETVGRIVTVGFKQG